MIANGLTPLRNGCRIGIAHQGDPAAVPVFFFHGWGASRLAIHPDDTLARTAGARVLSLDRPGVGLSARQAGYRLLDWPKVVAEVADAYGIDRFAVLGWSAGGAYALACAAALPDRVTRAAVVSGSVPILEPDAKDQIVGEYRWIAFTNRFTPWLIKAILDFTAWQVAGSIEKSVDQQIRGLTPSDKAIASDPEVRSMLIESTRELVRQGAAGLVDDGRALNTEWGFALRDITIPVSIWHGEADVNNPVGMGRYLADRLPNVTATFVAGGAHLLYLSHWQQILTDLVRTR